MAITTIRIKSEELGTIEILGDDLSFEDMNRLPAILGQIFFTMTKREVDLTGGLVDKVRSDAAAPGILGLEALSGALGVDASVRTGQDLIDAMINRARTIIAELAAVRVRAKSLAEAQEVLAEKLGVDCSFSSICDRVATLIQIASGKGKEEWKFLEGLADALGIDWIKYKKTDDYLSAMEGRARTIIAELAAATGAARLLCDAGNIDTEGVTQAVKMIKMAMNLVEKSRYDLKRTSDEVGVLCAAMQRFGFDVPASPQSEDSKRITTVAHAMDLYTREGYKLLDPTGKAKVEEVFPTHDEIFTEVEEASEDGKKLMQVEFTEEMGVLMQRTHVAMFRAAVVGGIVERGMDEEEISRSMKAWMDKIARDRASAASESPSDTPSVED